GDKVEAKKCYENALSIYTQKLGNNHQKTQKVMLKLKSFFNSLLKKNTIILLKKIFAFLTIIEIFKFFSSKKNFFTNFLKKEISKWLTPVDFEYKEQQNHLESSSKKAHWCRFLSTKLVEENAVIKKKEKYNTRAGNLSIFLINKKSGEQCKFSSDGGKILSSSKDKIIKIWNIETGKQI
ncbi:hypothetical protein RFI_20845, partial [Reticulomyxa filosa]